ncbi:MAG: hypothetical protein GY713_05695 [Actinomycetia bacterium]|nr:hypothetical protein [Actinomycetes bacterium]
MSDTSPVSLTPSGPTETALDLERTPISCWSFLRQLDPAWTDRTPDQVRA